MLHSYNIFLSQNGADILLGHLTFDAENNSVLALSGSGPAFDQLQQRWDETSAQPSLEVTRTRREKMEGGGWMESTVVENIEKSSPDYPAVVVHYLGTKFGYMLFTRAEAAEEE